MKNFEVWSKRNRRVITEFIASELVYDFVSERLDHERRTAMVEAVEKYPSLSVQIDSVLFGLEYTRQLQKTEVSKKFLAELEDSSNYLKVFRRQLRINDWSPAFRVGLEVFSVITAVGLISFFTPWNYVISRLNWDQNKNVTISEIAKRPTEAVEDTLAVAPNEDKPLFEDEKTVVAADSAKKPKDEESPKQSQPTPTQTVAASAEVAPSAVPPVPPVSPPKTETTTAEATNASKTEKPAPATTGFIYRGKIKVSNIEATSPKIKDRIEELGGRKAGEVELGWQKGEGNYFHFTMPEKSYPELIKLLEDYSGKKVNISKDKHQRVMPDGIIRLILEVEPVKDAQSSP